MMEHEDEEEERHQAEEEEEHHHHQQQYLQIHDFQHYLNTRGLRDETAVGMSSELNVSEACQRLADEKAYQERIHQRVFGEDGLNPEERSKKEFLDAIDDNDDDSNRIKIRSMDGTIIESTVKQLASQCDTVYALVVSRDRYNQRIIEDEPGDTNNNTKPSKSSTTRQQQHPLELSLEAYSHDSVEEFIQMIHGDKSPNNISPELIVECCQIAHYVQCTSLLTPLVNMLIEAVDTANCRSLLELADRLSLPSLFERSLSHMMKSLDEQTEDVWDDLNKELKDRIALMKEAIESSVLTGKKSRLYFGSIQEYLAMFAETVQYHRERLGDAKERQAEERESYLVRRSNNNAWEYNQRFIDLQEKRVERLELVMKKQKEMFCSTTRTTTTSTR